MLASHTFTLKQDAFVEKKSAPRGRRSVAALGAGWIVGVLGATLAVGGAYLVTLNAQSTRGFVLGQLESQKTALTRDVRTLDSRIGELSSIGVIETAAQSMEFVAADDVQYFVEQTGVAAATDASGNRN